MDSHATGHGTVKRDPASIQWHEDNLGLQPLVGRPALAIIQLNRSLLQMERDSTLVQLPVETLHTTSFTGAGLHVFWQQYRIRAAVLHRGHTAAEGHYQTALWQESKMWIADHNQLPAQAAWTNADEADVYLLCMTPEMAETSAASAVEVGNARASKPSDIREILNRSL